MESSRRFKNSKRLVIFSILLCFILMSGCSHNDSANLNHGSGNGELIKLPEPVFKSDYSVEESLKNRRSVRSYSNIPVTLKQISQVLWAAYGVTEPSERERLRGGKKTAPSAGATYPLEIYLVAGEVDGIDPGIYRYLPENHSLKKKQSGDKRNKLFVAALQPWVKTAPASLVYSAVFERTANKYRERGRNRYVCMDLGHSAQNVYLQCTALGLGTVAVGSFNDKKLKTVIGMPEEETPLYIMPIGHLKK